MVVLEMHGRFFSKHELETCAKAEDEGHFNGTYPPRSARNYLDHDGVLYSANGSDFTISPCRKHLNIILCVDFTILRCHPILPVLITTVTVTRSVTSTPAFISTFVTLYTAVIRCPNRCRDIVFRVFGCFCMCLLHLSQHIDVVQVSINQSMPNE